MNKLSEKHDLYTNDMQKKLTECTLLKNKNQSLNNNINKNKKIINDYNKKIDENTNKYEDENEKYELLQKRNCELKAEIEILVNDIENNKAFIKTVQESNNSVTKINEEIQV